MNKKKIIILLLVTILLLITGNKTYAYYVMNTNISVNSQSSNLICDAEIQEVPSSQRNIFGYSEFKVVVKNYDSSNNITNESFNYNLTIGNKNSSNGLFGYNNQFNETLSINDSMNNTTAYEKEYIIQVKSNNGQSSNINYNIKLDCTQTN